MTALSEKKPPLHLPQIEEAWLQAKVSDVASQRRAWVYLQGPNMVGFGIVTPSQILWPKDSSPLAPSLTEDLRLFGDLGEWHVWKRWDSSYHARFRTVPPSSSGPIQPMKPQAYLLWGKSLQTEGSRYALVEEMRGATIPFPDAPWFHSNPALPISLQVQPILDFHPETGLAGIVDVLWLGLYDKDKRPLPP